MKLTNSQYDAIMRQYDAKQSISRNTLAKRTNEVNSRIPEYAELTQETTSLYASAARNALLGNPADREALKTRLAELNLRKKELLESHGFSPDYLEPVYECNLCKDTGMNNGAKCSCFIQASIDLLYNQSKIKKILRLENFSNFNYDWYSESYIDANTGVSALENILNVTREADEFISSFPNGGNMLIYGNTGVGKTFITHCIAKELLDKGHSVLYLSAVDLFEIFSKHTFDNNNDTDSREYVSQILDCELLIIDDLGTELANSFTNSKLFYCINERINQELSTIISTNLNLPDIMNMYSERIFSRLTMSYKFYKIFGDDIRLKKSNF